MKNKIKVAFIGCGNMARAIISSMNGPAARAALKANGDVFDITVADRNESKLMEFKRDCRVTVDNKEAVAAADYVLLCVKPQNADEVFALDLKEKVVISIMAGISVERLKEKTGSSRIVRVMPNLNARVGESFNAYVPYGVSGETLRVVQVILGSFGAFREVKESDMDAVTGITGSGPAFVFMTIKAFYDEAVARGFSPEAAKEMAVQTVLGSVLTAEKASDDLDTLVASVCSKGGTTIRGVDYLNAHGYVDTLRAAISESIKRSEEMTRS